MSRAAVRRVHGAPGIAHRTVLIAPDGQEFDLTPADVLGMFEGLTKAASSLYMDEIYLPGGKWREYQSKDLPKLAYKP